MKESVVGHPVHLHLARVVVVKETSARGLATQVQELVDLLNGLEGFLMEGEGGRERGRETDRRTEGGRQMEGGRERGREREGGRQRKGEREEEGEKRGEIVKCVTDGNTDG